MAVGGNSVGTSGFALFEEDEASMMYDRLSSTQWLRQEIVGYAAGSRLASERNHGKLRVAIMDARESPD